MRVKLLTLAFTPSLGGFDDRPLTSFLADKDVLAVREHFFSVHDQPYLACLISWQPVGSSDAPGPAPPGRPRRRSRGEAPDVPPEARALLETLRTWRRDRAREEGRPPYILFTHRELAAIATTRPPSAAALLQIEGVGPGLPPRCQLIATPDRRPRGSFAPRHRRRAPR